MIVKVIQVNRMNEHEAKCISNIFSVKGYERSILEDDFEMVYDGKFHKLRNKVRSVTQELLDYLGEQGVDIQVNNTDSL